MDNNIAISCLKNDLISFSSNRIYDKLVVSYEIYNDGTHPIKYILKYNNIEDDDYYGIPPKISIQTMRALFFIRDTLLKETGKRIWGLTFTLYPDGKHEIEYDYNVPEGFNEKGEWIGEEHNNEAVGEFFDNIRKIGTDDFELK